MTSQTEDGQLRLFDAGPSLRPLRQKRELLVTQGDQATNTQITYRRGWRRFEEFTAEHGFRSLPAASETVQLFALHLVERGRRMAGITIDLAAIMREHKQRGLASPRDQALTEFLRALRRARKEKPQGKEALPPELLLRISEALLERQKKNFWTAAAVRARAVIVVGFSLGWRRSELASLDYEDLKFQPKGVLVRLGASKCDQTGKYGRQAALHYGRGATCPVTALNDWLGLRGNGSGPLFTQFTKREQAMTNKRLTTARIEQILHAVIKAAGIDPAPYSPHSLRSGMITAAIENGANLIAIAERSGHANVQMLARYFKPVRSFQYDVLANVL